MRFQKMGCGICVVGLAVASGCVPPGSGEPTESARVRVVHASPDAPAVDVCADGAELFTGAAFPAATDYAEVPAATYAVAVVAANAGCDSAAVIEADLPLAADSDTTVVALNTLENIEPLVLSDDNSDPMAGMAKVRFVHASPDAPTVDITLADGTTLFDDIAFRGVGDYLQVPGGTYDLQVRDETGAVVVLELPGVEIPTGAVVTVYAIGFAAGEPSLDVLISVDNG